ncbi:MAG TPA: helix-turn-helix domain-containing protein [Gemmataceae bacterium]|nr:helix-turn-helix domain-containing protein [Terriglobia bacterium]HZV07726.1 helix-turn-helix domain-containing protein [Gemmataceae bacterium]
MSNREGSRQTSSEWMEWDSRSYPTSKAFSLYRDSMNSVLMPWAPELIKGSRPFQARIETMELEQASVIRVKCNPLLVARTSLGIAKSSMACFYISQVLSGKFSLRQAGRETFAGPGDVVLFDSEERALITHDAANDISLLLIAVPKDQMEKSCLEDHFTNLLIPKSAMLPVFSSCLEHLTDASPPSKREVSALCDASVALLPLAAGCFGQEADRYFSSELLARICEYVRDNLSNANLSPTDVALEFGISVRYVQKLFGMKNTSFTEYVLRKRLDGARLQLNSPQSGTQSVATIAYNWGFNDISYFHRVFKRRYGCTPKAFRHIVVG